MRCSILFILLAITFGRSLSQSSISKPTQQQSTTLDNDVESKDAESLCGGYCYSAVKPMLEYLAILQKRVEACEAKQPADTLSKIALMEEKLETLGRQMAIQQELEKSSQAKIQNLEQQLAAKQEEIPKPRAKNLELFKSIGSKFYYIENENKSSWQGALDKCREMGAHLASLQSEDEIRALRRMLKPYHNYWIDLNDLETEGEFISATTGVKGTFFHWQENEPSNALNSEHCVELHTFSSEGEMNDRMCDETHNFICEISLDKST